MLVLPINYQIILEMFVLSAEELHTDPDKVAMLNFHRPSYIAEVERFIGWYRRFFNNFSSEGASERKKKYNKLIEQLKQCLHLFFHIKTFQSHLRSNVMPQIKVLGVFQPRN